MSMSNLRGNNDFPTDRSTDEKIEFLLDVVKRQQETINQQSETIEELEDRLDAVEDEQRERQEHAAKERANNRKRLTNVEERVDAVEDRDGPHTSSGEDGNADGHVTPETPLEQTVSLPQELIDEESANVQRAVFVASDVKDYTTSCPAGRVIKAGELGRVLRAGTDCNGHSQTIDRVIQILDDLGGEDVKVVDRRGERRVVFTEEIVERLEQLTTTEDHSTASHGVVIQGGT